MSVPYFNAGNGRFDSWRAEIRLMAMGVEQRLARVESATGPLPETSGNEPEDAGPPDYVAYRVTLMGVVHSSDEKEGIAENLASIPGVRAVDNCLEVDL